MNNIQIIFLKKFLFFLSIKIRGKHRFQVGIIHMYCRGNGYIFIVNVLNLNYKNNVL